MSARARRPTDDAMTEVHDPGRARALRSAVVGAARRPAPATLPAPAGPPPPAASKLPPYGHATPTHVDPWPPVRVISMKQASAVETPRHAEPRTPLHVQLRSLAEVTGRDAPHELGRLAPPLDPRRARARRRRTNALLACLALALVCVVMFAIWLIAG